MHLFQFHKGTIRTFLGSLLCLLEVHFNSIKVRLELPSATAATWVPIFQFHKGTIRTQQAKSNAQGLPYFNSIKVRLELCQVFQVQERCSFQFHKGTIRTSNTHLTELLSNIFQFHKGTIRTSDIKTAKDVYDANFNSIKVRLEQRDLLRNYLPFQFQFHKGTIRTTLSSLQEHQGSYISIP